MYQFVVRLLEPHTILVLLAGVALFRLWRKRREPEWRLWPLVVPLLLLAVISMPAVAHLATLSLESGYDPRERTPDAEAVVVFGAGLYVPEGPRLRAELSEDGLRRCLHAARLYGAGSPCPVVVSGGKVDPDEPGPTEAAAMRDLLVRLGVRESDIVVEDRSRTTYENAVESAKLLKERDIGRVVLVVDALDMPRAARCLEKQGIEVVPSPCHYRATRFRRSVFSFIPNPSGAAGFQRVWHEWLGLAWYRVRGRI